MDFFPIFLRLKDQPALVVGGGDVAERKISLLLETDADVTVVSPALNPALQLLADRGQIRHLAQAFDENLVSHYKLVIAATNDSAVNQRVSEVTQDLNIPVNVVDQPELCSFITPAIVDRSPIVVAISTGGSSPVLARMIRSRIESLVPASYGRLVTLALKYRGQVIDRFTHIDARRKFWERVLGGKLQELVFSGRDAEAERLLAKTIEQPDNEEIDDLGEVYLVGAGPGDPDLLTFRALRLMQQADVVLHDRLVSKEILNMVRRDAERIYVGKRKADHAVPQEEINRLLLTLAKQGKRVLRLKGGDPFIFGRGGEEIRDLFHENIPFQVVPELRQQPAAVPMPAFP